MVSTIDEIWADDRLGRKDDAAHIETFLMGRLAERREASLPTAYVLNINAPWGTGKSFFMERLALQLVASGHLVASVNAWATDHAEDPLLAVMAAIQDAVKPLLGKASRRPIAVTLQGMTKNAGEIAVVAAKGAAVSALRKVFGEAVSEIAAIIDGEQHKGDASFVARVTEAASGGATDALSDKIETLINVDASGKIDAFRRGQEAINDFKTGLAKLTSQLTEQSLVPPLFVLVDELDRCRPTYAISLLERAKHLFEVDNVVFIVATDTVQLASAVRAVYGANFDSPRYLNRFFDRTYQFDEPDIRSFVREMLEATPIDQEQFVSAPEQTMTTMLVHIFTNYATAPRDMLRVYDLLRTIVTLWKYAHPIELTAMLPLAIAVQSGLAGTWEDDATMAALQLRRPDAGTLSWRYFVERRETRTASFVVSEAIAHWRAARNVPLHEASSFGGGDPTRSWISSQLEREFARAHGSTYVSGTPGPYSLVREYPALIRKAGKFSTQAG